MNRRCIFILIGAVLLPSLVFAHGTNYLEFNPDQGSSLKVIDVATPSQVFFAQNDFLGGFDVWLANPGSSGTATFALLNEQGTVLTTRTVTIPYIAQTSNGTKLHVDLNSQIAVLADQKYSIRITSSMPELRLYYSDRVQLISFNSPFVSPYITGVAKLGSEEQNFSFKYALYETTESSAPIISNISWIVVSSTEMKIEFNANEPIDYKVEYGPSGLGYIQTTNFLGGYQFCAEGIAVCSINISVNPNSVYQYRLTVKDSWGNQSQSTGTFQSGQEQAPTPTPTQTPSPSSSGSPTPSTTTTPTSSMPPPPNPTPTPDLGPLFVSNLRIVSVTDKTVEVAWTTNNPANSHLLISTPFLITVTDASDPTVELEHVLGTTNILGFSTNYIATITSIDSTNNEARASISFITLAPVIATSPTPQPSAPPTQVTQGSDGSIQWSSSSGGEPSDGYRVDVFDKNGNFVRSVYVPVSSNGVNIPGLEEGEYSVIVYSNNDGVFKKIDQPVSLKVESPFFKRLLSFWWALIPLLAGLGYIFWRNKKKASQPPVQVVP